MNIIETSRIKMNLKQEDIAKAMGVTQATVSMWENGKASPSASKLMKLANLLGCKVEDLLREDAQR